MLTKYKPIMAQVEGRDFMDAYIVPGEPVGMRNFCDMILRVMDKPVVLKRGESVLINIDIRLIEFDEIVDFPESP
jgi:hypothetical protein